jgi:hypothetical protein
MRTLGYMTVVVGLLTAAACSSADPSGSIVDDAPVNNKKKAAPEEEETRRPAPEEPPAAAPTPAPTPPAPDAITKDGIKNGDETDVDCGGAKAPGCADGKACSAAKDCVNNICTSGQCKAPAVPTQYCQQLGASGCCNTLASTVEKLACIGVQFAGKEIACQGELALCGIGGIGGTPCGNLNKCCDFMVTDGYPQDAADCRTHNTGNASQCSGWLSQYKSMGWCP